jgi:hypothetical protein
MKRKSLFWVSLILSIAILALAAGGRAYSRTHPLVFARQSDMHHNPAAVLISESDLAEKYGLQLTLVATTAMNSWVDVRLKVLDAQKAQTILENPNRNPVLRVETGSHQMIPTPSNKGAHHHTLQTGMIYYMLFPNRHNVIRSGTPVRVVFGDLALDTVITQ